MVIKSYEEAAKLLKTEEVGVIPSDTLYGFSCSAFCKKCARSRQPYPHSLPAIFSTLFFQGYRWYRIGPTGSFKNQLYQQIY